MPDFRFEVSKEEEKAMRPLRRLEVHAHGLLQPSHMEWTQDGRLLCSEFGRGRVVDVTRGGNMREAEPFAWGFRHPAGLLTNYEGDRILVADTGARCVREITKGGDVSNAKPFFRDVPGPYGLLSYKAGADIEYYCTYSTGVQNGLTRMKEDGLVMGNTHRITGFPNGLRETPYFMSDSQREGDCGCWMAVGYKGKMLYLHSGLGAIFEIDGHSEYSTKVPILARGLEKPLGMITHPTNGHLYVAERAGGSVKVVPHDAEEMHPDGIDMRYVPPVAVGFKEPSCVRFDPDGGSMYVCDMASCCIWRVWFF